MQMTKKHGVNLKIWYLSLFQNLKSEEEDDFCPRITTRWIVWFMYEAES